MHRYIDAHIHLYEFDNVDIILKNKNFIFIGVSEDVKSTIETIKLSLYYENVIPAVGIHPWNVNKVNLEDLKIIEKIIKDYNIKVLGEIGLDKRFVPETFEKQLEIFEFFLRLSKEYDLSLNLHTPKAEKEVFDLLIKYDIKKAYFHWYSGNEQTLSEIINQDYLIGINVSAIINKKYEKYIEKVDIRNILTESDGPYDYHRILLHPDKLIDLYKKIFEIKKIDLEDLVDTIRKNLKKFIY